MRASNSSNPDSTSADDCVNFFRASSSAPSAAANAAAAAAAVFPLGEVAAATAVAGESPVENVETLDMLFMLPLLLLDLSAPEGDFATSGDVTTTPFAAVLALATAAAAAGAAAEAVELSSDKKLRGGLRRKPKRLESNSSVERRLETAIERDMEELAEAEAEVDASRTS